MNPNLFSLSFLLMITITLYSHSQTQLKEINTVPSPDSTQMISIENAYLIDGTGNPPIENAVITILGNRIVNAGKSNEVMIPQNAAVIDAEGKTVMPGLIDSHYHLGRNTTSPANFLKNGVTSVRDPGAWMETYVPSIESGEQIPRLFLTGPHLDQFPPAYPANSVILRDEEETRNAVNKFINDGASAIKVYFRLPVALIRATCETAHARGVVVVAHLEIVDARDGIRAGLDGIEHITSFGSALMPYREAETWRQSMLNENNFRRDGRFKIWSELDLESPQAKELLDLIVENDVYVSATLGAFEKRAGDKDTEEYHIKAFENMMKFTGMCKRHGARVTTGSHTWVAHAEGGWAYQREMELLAESGLTNMEVITASTMDNARFFKIEERLGSITPGKIADIVIIDGNPLDDIKAMYNIDQVMLNGIWVK